MHSFSFGVSYAEHYFFSIRFFMDTVSNEFDNKMVKTNVTLPAWLKEAAEKENVNYSKILEAALVYFIKSSPKPQSR